MITCKVGENIINCYDGKYEKEQLNDNRIKHNMAHSRIYQIWCDIKQRCFNVNCKAYKNYGGREITICEEWKDNFQLFYYWAITNGYDDTLTIERINVNENYEPNNCTWATMKTQANNRRDNHIICIDGIEHTLEEWIKIKGISKNTIMKRIKRGWDDSKLFEQDNTQERYVTINNVKHSLNEWSQISGIPKQNIIYRLFKGWSGEKLLSPIKNKKER